MNPSLVACDSYLGEKVVRGFRKIEGKLVGHIRTIKTEPLKRISKEILYFTCYINRKT